MHILVQHCMKVAVTQVCGVFWMPSTASTSVWKRALLLLVLVHSLAYSFATKDNNLMALSKGIFLIFLARNVVCLWFSDMCSCSRDNPTLVTEKEGDSSCFIYIYMCVCVCVCVCVCTLTHTHICVSNETSLNRSGKSF